MWFVFFLLFFVHPSRAEEITDYLYQYDLYNQSYQIYNEKKQINTKYNTIATQKELFSSTLNAINSRNTTLKTYLIALQISLNKYLASDPEPTQKLQNELIKWENWIDSQQSVVSTLNTEKELNLWASNFKQKYPQIQNTIYSALTQNEINLRLQTLSRLQLVASDIKVDPDIKPQSLQWLDSLNLKSDIVKTSLDNAKSIYQKNLDQPTYSDFYSDVKFETSTAIHELKETSNNLKLTIVKFITK